MNNVCHEGTRRVVPFNVAIAAASSLLVHMPWLETSALIGYSSRPSSLRMDADREGCVQSLYGVGKIMDEVFLEDLAVGQLFGSGRLRITAEDIKRFAAEYDPQPFHLDEQTARSTLFRGLAASGWHTAALTMRLLVDSEFRPSGGLVGAGLEELRWPRPVRPGDELRIETEILALRPSRSRSGQGIVKIRVTTFNQADKPVQIYVANVVVLGRRKEEQVS